MAILRRNGLASSGVVQYYSSMSQHLHWKKENFILRGIRKPGESFTGLIHKLGKV